MIQANRNSLQPRTIVSFLQNMLLLFRDDVIWFVDKDDQTLSSGLYCLEDVKTDAGFTCHFSVYNFYKHGRLGAVPKFEV